MIERHLDPILDKNKYFRIRIQETTIFRYAKCEFCENEIFKYLKYDSKNYENYNQFECYTCKTQTVFLTYRKCSEAKMIYI